jgi:hypothetical protein
LFFFQGYKVEEAQFSFFSNVHIIDDQNVSDSNHNGVAKEDNERNINKKQLEGDEKKDNRANPLAQTQSLHPPVANNNHLNADRVNESMSTLISLWKSLQLVCTQLMYMSFLFTYHLFCRTSTRKRTFGKVTNTSTN